MGPISCLSLSIREMTLLMASDTIWYMKKAPQIEKAREMGFCFGVKRAIAMLEKAAREYGSVETLGAVVHNQMVVERLAKLGIKVAESLDHLQGKVVAISSHGVAPQVLEEIRARRLQLVDTTCPRVRSAQRAARRLAEAGFDVIIFGDAQHPEVKGVLGWTGGRGMATLDEQALAQCNPLPRRLGIVSQTTQNPAHFARFAGRLIELALPQAVELRLVNTICDATGKRQAAALELAQRCGLMLVIGGHASANTRHLAETCSTVGVETHLIEEASEIEVSWLQGRSHIGIAAGASTPAGAVEEVVRRVEFLTGRVT